MLKELPIIRRATIDDYESIAQLHFLSHTLSFAPFASEHWLNSRRPDHYLHKWRDILSRASDRSLNLVARSAGKTVGMVRVARSEIPESAPDKNSAELSGMHVAPGLTGQGIG
ncbi:MAG: GNAT family N-acetyltransferase, partial [Chloroflexi bacterium]|nr:GNAT family N-acetyltransferase [Chloroflexota bacterium]